MLKALFLIFLSVCDGGANKRIPLEDVVDRIEINHFMNDEGIEQLNQVIFWNYSPSLESYVVCSWRSVKPDMNMPYKTKAGGYVMHWHDTRDGVYRKVYAKTLIETYTNYDPETTNQELVDRLVRKELTPKEKTLPKKKK